ncbi:MULTISPECIES: CAP domain-containing protein [unclassified Phyllobacterium]|uniref:CAP domain-containing protein n=1 Tax=unclassified Phyllobacterium TaxID=2638441 RepID=UPI000E0F4D21
MPNTSFQISRRHFIGLAAVGTLLPLAACQTIGPAGNSMGASASASANINNIRNGNGLSGLESDAILERAAGQQAAYMAKAGRMVHTTGWGKSFEARVKTNEIHGAAAENIAMGRMDIDRLFAMWMASPPHRRNMLDARFKRYGLAYAEAKGGSGERYWALVLAS